MIKQIAFGGIPDGAMMGIPAFMMFFTSGKDEEQTLEEVLKLIYFNQMKGKDLVVNLRGSFPKDDDEFITSLIFALKKDRAIIQIDTKGDEFHQWYPLGNRMVIHVDDKKEYPLLPCNELVYHLTTDEGPIVDIDAPLPMTTISNVDRGPRSKQEILDFIKESKHAWRIYPKTLQPCVEILYTKEKKENDSTDE